MMIGWYPDWQHGSCVVSSHGYRHRPAALRHRMVGARNEQPAFLVTQPRPRASGSGAYFLGAACVGRAPASACFAGARRHSSLQLACCWSKVIPPTP